MPNNLSTIYRRVSICCNVLSAVSDIGFPSCRKKTPIGKWKWLQKRTIDSTFIATGCTRSPFSA